MAKIIFGQLEQAVMDVLWDRGSATVREVLAALPAARQVAYTTVMTVMNRLVAQRVLRRTAGTTGAFVYAPAHSRQATAAAATQASIDQMVRQYGDVALVHFMAALDEIPAEKIAKLKKLSRGA